MSSSSRKRNNPDSSSSSMPRPSKRRGIVPPTTPKKFKQDAYHLKKGDIPEDAAGFKVALETHIRILLGAVTASSVPEAPDAHVVNTFGQRFTDAREVDRLLKGRTTFQNSDRAALQSLKDLRTRCATDPTSNIVLAITRVPENALRLIFSTIHSFGLPSWRPELLNGTPTSLYNGALESIAVWTFEQAVSSFAYTHLSPNLRYIPDTSLIQKLYKSFLWSYLKGLALKERKAPGSVSRAVKENKAYKARLELTERRRQFLRNNGWNESVQLLAEDVECTSDQEPNPNPAASGFFIMHKRARNPHITHFLHNLDDQRRRGTPLFRNQRRNTRQEEPRIPHPDKQESRISERLPRSCPLDWFDPKYFNSMDIRFRALYVDAPIALPLPEHCSPEDNRPIWKGMQKTEFMEKYGDDVRAKYNIPTAEEIAALDDGEEEEGNHDNGQRQPSAPQTQQSAPQTQQQLVPPAQQQLAPPTQQQPTPWAQPSTPWAQRSPFLQQPFPPWIPPQSAPPTQPSTPWMQPFPPWIPPQSAPPTQHESMSRMQQQSPAQVQQQLGLPLAPGTPEQAPQTQVQPTQQPPLPSTPSQPSHPEEMDGVE